MRAVLDLVLPQECASCGRPGPAACAACAAPLRGVAALAWPRPSPAALPPPFAVASYSGSVRDLLLAFKERGVSPLRRPLGAALAESVRVATAGRPHRAPVMLVPVPSSASARRARGEDVVAVLTRTAATLLRSDGYDVGVAPVLRHARRVRDSAGLTATARAANLDGAFGLRRGGAPLVARRSVVVVDDLITTGSTAAECSRVLRAAGASVVAVATVAATRRTNP